MTDTVDARLQSLVNGACQRSLKEEDGGMRLSKAKHLVDQNILSYTNNPLAESRRPFFEKAQTIHRQKVERILRGQLEEAEDELAECTFQPKINKPGGPRNAASAAASAAAPAQEPVFDRLYDIAQQKMRRDQDNFARSMSPDPNVCTFKPTMFTNYSAKPRPRPAVRPRPVPSEMKECLFKPLISPMSKRIVADKEYVPIQDRPALAAAAATAAATKGSPSDASPPSPTSSLASSEPRTRSTAESFQAFIGRQSQLIEKRRATADRVVAAKSRELTFQPAINPVSKAIAEERARRDRPLSDPASPQASPREHAEHTTAAAAARGRRGAGDEDLTFQPRINDISRQITAAMSLSPAHVRLYQNAETLERRERLLHDADRDLREACPFRPTLLADGPRVEARVANYDELIQHVRDDEEYRKAVKESLDQAREQEEFAQCTFRPRILSAPESIRKIVAELRKSRSPK